MVYDQFALKGFYVDIVLKGFKNNYVVLWGLDCVPWLSENV